MKALPRIESFAEILISNQELRSATIDQLNKDLSRSGELFRIESEWSGTEILERLEEWFEQRLRQNPEKVQALCYLIDVEELHMMAYFNSMSINSRDFVLRMLFREFKKVFFRMQMKS